MKRWKKEVMWKYDFLDKHYFCYSIIPYRCNNRKYFNYVCANRPTYYSQPFTYYFPQSNIHLHKPFFRKMHTKQMIYPKFLNYITLLKLQCSLAMNEFT